MPIRVVNFSKIHGAKEAFQFPEKTDLSDEPQKPADQKDWKKLS